MTLDATTQFWLEVAKVAVTLIAAGVAAWVAYSIGSSQRDIARQQAATAAEQKRIAAAKLNLELFEERYALFYQVWEFLSTPQRKKPEGPTLAPKFVGPLYGAYTNLFPRAEFLFGQEIADYMRETHKQRIALDTVMTRIESQNHVPMPDDAKEIQALDKYFFDEASNCFKRFAPYLDFSAWKAQ